MPDGPADRDGRIRPGDRLIAINDQTIEGMQQAVQLIREAQNFVKLCISHIKPPGSVRRKLSDDVIPIKLKTSIADPSDILIYQENVHCTNSLHDKSDDSFNDDDVNNLPHTDVHTADVSTMSQIESIKSEIVEEHYAPCNTGKYMNLFRIEIVKKLNIIVFEIKRYIVFKDDSFRIICGFLLL